MSEVEKVCTTGTKNENKPPHELNASGSRSDGQYKRVGAATHT